MQKYFGTLAQESCLEILTLVCSDLDSSISKSYIQQFLDRHPFSPTASSLCDFLSMCNVENLLLEIDPNAISKMRFPLITTINSGNEFEYVLVISVSNEVVSYFSGSTEVVVSLSEFQKMWNANPIILYSIEDYKRPSDLNTVKGKRLKKILHGLLAVSLIIGIVSFKIFNYEIISKNLAVLIAVLICVIIALGVNYLILLKELGWNSPRLNKFCSTDGEDGCQFLLSSKYAKIYKNISWSSLGFYFFSSIFFFILLVPALNDNVYSHLVLVFLLTIPEAVISIALQKWFFKKWCRLCVVIQVIAIFCAVLLLCTSPKIGLPADWLLPYWICAIGLSVISWYLLNVYLKNVFDLEGSVKDLKSAKYDPKVIQSYFGKDSHRDLSFGVSKVLSFGNDDSDSSILYITNPKCPKCAQSQLIIERLIRQYDVTVNIAFHLFPDSDDEEKLIHYLQQLFAKDKELFLDGMRRWYSDIHQSLDVWKKNYEELMEITDDTVLPIVESDSINQSPALYFNKVKLPDFYEIEDVIYLLRLI